MNVRDKQAFVEERYGASLGTNIKIRQVHPELEIWAKYVEDVDEAYLLFTGDSVDTYLSTDDHANFYPVWKSELKFATKMLTAHCILWREDVFEYGDDSTSIALGNYKGMPDTQTNYGLFQRVK